MHKAVANRSLFRNGRVTALEAVERLALLLANGDTDRAFGRSYLTKAKAWKTHSCAQMAAE
jgi:hypothetical protein